MRRSNLWQKMGPCFIVGLTLFSSSAHADCSTTSPPTCALIAASASASVTPTAFSTPTPTCKKIVNNCTAKIMVPMGNQTAWTSFTNNPQPCVSLASCVSCTGSSQLFTSSGTFTPPCASMNLKVVVIGGGGGGGGNGSGNGDSEGSGASGYVKATTVTLSSATPIAVTVGAGSSHGVAGGTSSFGSYLTAAGGGATDSIEGIVGSGGSGGAGQGCYVHKQGGVNGNNGSGGCNIGPGNGQGYPIVSSATTIMNLTISSATFAAGDVGNGGGECGDGAGGILINGQSPAKTTGSSNSYGTCTSGTGYGAGGGGSFNYSGNLGTGSSGLSGAVYIEW